MRQIKYHNAKDLEGNIVSISDVTEHRTFYCIGCGKEMMAKLGKNREHHFAHKNSADNSNCSHETYLHKYAKLLLKHYFETQEHYYLYLWQDVKCTLYENCEYRNNTHLNNCECVMQKLTPFDLKQPQLYDTCELESGHYQNGKYYVADVKLSDSKNPNKEPLFIEIAVTHPCTPEKKESEIRIIEIALPKDIKEEELCCLSELRDSVKMNNQNDNVKISLYNFKPKVKRENINSHGFSVYYIADNMLKHFYQSKACQSFGKVRYMSFSPFEIHAINNDYGVVAAALKLRFPEFKNCISCKKYWRSKNSNLVFDKVYYNNCGEGIVIDSPSQANDCPMYEYSQFKTERNACGYRLEKGEIDNVYVLKQPVLYSDSMTKSIKLKCYGHVSYCNIKGGVFLSLSNDKLYGYQTIDLNGLQKGEYWISLGGNFSQKLVVR